MRINSIQLNNIINNPIKRPTTFGKKKQNETTRIDELNVDTVKFKQHPTQAVAGNGKTTKSLGNKISKALNTFFQPKSDGYEYDIMLRPYLI